MHDIMPPVGGNAQLIHSYGPAGFRIGQAEYSGPVLVLPTITHAWSGELTLEALAPLIPPPRGGRLGGGPSGHSVFDKSSLLDAHADSSPNAAQVPAMPPPQPSPLGGGSATELLLIGTGARHEMIAPALRNALKEMGLAVDTMDTGAACRTFNILLGEGRRVAVALRLPA
jgi:uncharacterized protein